MANISDILKQLSTYRDTFGIITQNDKDGGDSANRTGILYALLGIIDAHNDDQGRLILGGFRADLDKLTVSSGVFRRHPDTSKWYSFSGCFSRDQHAMLLLGAAALKDKRSLFNLTKRFFLRLGFHQNTYDTGPTSKRVMPDIMAPGELTTIIRGFRLYPLYPVLVVLDAVLCLDNYFRKGFLWGADSLIAVRLMYDLNNLPTPFTYVNRYLYRKSDYQAQIARYYTNVNNNGIPPLGDLYIEVAKEVIK